MNAISCSAYELLARGDAAALIFDPLKIHTRPS